jgi:endonuclease YncB( thermonuclease family)
MSLEKDKKLKKVRSHEIKRFSLKRLKAKAKVVSIHDGDTCDLAFYRGEEMVRFNCRLEDIDAPELQEANGELVRDFLAHLCMGKDADEFDDAKIWNKKDLQKELNKSENLVYAVFGKFGKYGRALVTLKKSSRARGRSINDMVSDYAKKLEDDSDATTSSESTDASESSCED